MVLSIIAVYSDDDLKDWPPISSFLAFMSSVSAHHQEGLSTNMTSIMLNFQAVVASVFSVGELKSKNIYTFIIDLEMTFFFFFFFVFFPVK